MNHQEVAITRSPWSKSHDACRCPVAGAYSNKAGLNTKESRGFTLIARTGLNWVTHHPTP